MIVRGEKSTKVFKDELSQYVTAIYAEDESRMYAFNDFNPKYTRCSVCS